MPTWTEATLRAAASWQAFKEGKALFESDAVSDAKATADGWVGTVRTGKKPLRVAVKVISEKHIEARCPCPDNQRNGAVCSHAVAAGLAVLSPSKVEAKVSVRVEKPRAWNVAFGGTWRESIKRGRLAVTLSECEGTAFPADDRITAWLAAERVVLKPVLHLTLADAQIDAFLTAAAGHPRINGEVEIRTDGKISIATLERMQDEAVLIAEGNWQKLGGSFWQADEMTLTRVGDVPADLVPLVTNLITGKPVKVAVTRLLERLPAWQEALRFPEDSWLDAIHFVPAPATFQLLLGGSLDRLEATLTVSYGEHSTTPCEGTLPGLPRFHGDVCEVRDDQNERAAIRRMEQAGFVKGAEGGWQLQGQASVLRFLTHTLPELRSIWTVIESTRFAAASKQVAVVSPKIEFHGSGEDWLSFDLTFQSNDGTVIDVAEVRRMLRSGPKSGAAAGRRIVLSDEVAELIDPLFEDLDLRQENGRFIAPKRTGEVVRELQRRFQQGAGKSEVATPAVWEQPAGFIGQLRDYQQRGATWLSDRIQHFGGAVLADDMGLGKTIQTIAAIERLAGREATLPVLVIATASLLGNWRDEFARFAPARQVRLFHGAGRESERGKIGPGDVILTTYSTLARDLAFHLQQEYLAVVADEASLMRNPDTDHAKAVSKLRAQAKIALTGTPVENGVRDLWSIFRFVQPDWLGGRREFQERYEKPLADGDTSAMERLRLKISPFVLRRTKEQVAADLPAKIKIDTWCELSSDQQGVYRDLLSEGRKKVDAIADSGNAGAARMQMLTALLRLRQTCCDLSLLGSGRLKQLSVSKRSAKLERLLELLEEAISGNHRILVFSQFRTQLLEIEKCIAERGWDSLRLDGQSTNRQELVNKFQQTDGPPVFLISLKAGGYGLNLTAADIVIHFDPWWNPAAEAQASDRAHRIGQTRPVTIYRLLTKGTVEEKVVRLQEKKRGIASAIDEAGAGDAAGWSADELQDLLG